MLVRWSYQSAREAVDHQQRDQQGVSLDMRPLIRYAGYEPPVPHQRKVPVERALELRAQGIGWKRVAWELTLEFDRELPFTADGVYAAVKRARKKELT